MSRTLTLLVTILIICLIVATLGGLLWGNMRYVRTYPLEKDFLIPWLGARTFLEYGDSPYETPATQRAQIVYYGRLAAEGQDPLILSLPLPVELFYFPFALIKDYALARSIWMLCLEIALIASGYLSIQLFNRKPGRFLFPIILFFPLVWVYGAFAVISGNATGFVTLALAGFLLAMREELDELAGGLLVILVCAVRITGVLSIFAFFWIIYQRRSRVLWGFLMILAILLGLSFLFLPNWFLPFVRGVISQLTYNSRPSSIGIFASWSPVAGQRLGWVLSACLVAVLFFEWGRCFKKDFRTILWTASLSLAVTPLLGIPMLPRECPFLFIPVLLLMAILAERRSWLKRWGVAIILLVFILAGAWLMTFDLTRANADPVLTNILLLLVPAILVIGLLWTRWWFLHSAPTGLEEPLVSGNDSFGGYA